MVNQLDNQRVNQLVSHHQCPLASLQSGQLLDLNLNHQLNHLANQLVNHRHNRLVNLVYSQVVSRHHNHLVNHLVYRLVNLQLILQCNQLRCRHQYQALLI